MPRKPSNKKTSRASNSSKLPKSKKVSVKKIKNTSVENPMKKPTNASATWHEFYVKTEEKPVVTGSKAIGIEKVAQSKSPEHVFYRVRTFVGWMFVIVGIFGVLSIVASTANKTQEGVSSIFSTHLSQVSLFGPPPPEEIEIIATGDILLARHVEAQMRKRKDYTFPFVNVAEFLKSADITFGNLETAVMTGGTTPTGSTTFRADAASLDGLVFAGYDVISVANNHTMNFKAVGLLNAISELTKRSIAAVGGGANQDQAHTPAMREVKGKKIAFYAYTDAHIPGYLGFANGKEPGIARMDIEAVKNDVANALKSADMVVVSMHAGVEYKKLPSQFQIDFAHAAIDAGASVVIGHHPHVAEGVERYKDGVIMYSLGNFVFDQYFSADVRTGLVAKIILQDGEKPGLELYPSVTDNLSVQPRILQGQERTDMLAKMGIPEKL